MSSCSRIMERLPHRQCGAAALRCAVGCAVGLLILCCSATSLFAQQTVYDEDEVKAAFIYHFATFVEWPESAAVDGQVPFTIAVLGADTIADELEQFLTGRSIQGRPTRVQRLGTLAELDRADVLYIGSRYNARLGHIIEQIRDRPTLVVTDAPRALRDGATINFQVVDHRVQFEVSLAAAERAGLELSSRLLAAAMFVDTTSAVARPQKAVLAMVRP